MEKASLFKICIMYSSLYQKRSLNVVYTNKRKKDISVSISNVSKLKKEINITFRKKF